MTKAILGIILAIFILLGSFGIHIGIMIFGWGITPQSWGIIITGYFLLLLLSGFGSAMSVLFK